MQRATISVSEGRFPEARFGSRRIMEPSIGYAIARLRAQARELGTGILVEVDDRGTRLSLTIDAEGRLHTPSEEWAQAGAPAEERSDASASMQTLPIVPDGHAAGRRPGPSSRPVSGPASRSASGPASGVASDVASGPASGVARERIGHGDAPQDQRRTFTQDWRPAPAMTATEDRGRPGTRDPHSGSHGAGRLESATSEQDPHGFRSTLEHSNHALALAPHPAPNPTQTTNPTQTRSGSEAPTRSSSATSMQPNSETVAQPSSETPAQPGAQTPVEPGAQPRLARTGIIATLVVAALALCGAGLFLF